MTAFLSSHDGRYKMESVAVMMSGTIPHLFRFQTEASIVHIDYQINNNNSNNNNIKIHKKQQHIMHGVIGS